MSANALAVPSRFVFRPAARAVMQAPAPFGFSAIRARFEHSLICDDGVLIANYARRYGVSTIFVQLGGDDIASLLVRNPTTVKNLQAMIAVANVYLVVGDTSWLATPGRIPDDAVSAANVARAYPRLAGVLYDVDPSELAAWNSTQRQSLGNAFLALAANLLAMPGAASFKKTQFVAGAGLASVRLSENPHAPTILQRLEAMNGLSAIALRAPGNSAAAQLQNAAPALPQLTVPFSIVAGESKFKAATYYGATPAYLETNLAQIAQAAAQSNAAFSGIMADGWDDLYTSSQSILPQPPVYDGVLATGPPNLLIPAPGSLYLGAYVKGLASTLETSIGRRLAFDMHFYQWRAPFASNALAQDAANGRLPLVAWNCGDSDERVAHGMDDATIVQHAQAIKAYGGPVMIRWFWEMNLNDQNNPPRTQCWDPKSDLPNGYFAPMHYIAAWQHIRAVFDAQGVTNAIWLWCVANAHGGPSQYYPGDAYVDWVGMDDYDTNDVPLAQMLYIPANEISQFQEKPVMLTETGAHADYQQTFFSGAASDLAADYPWIRAVGYFDSQGTSQTWTLFGPSVDAFGAFANDPYLSALPNL